MRRGRTLPCRVPYILWMIRVTRLVGGGGPVVGQQVAGGVHRPSFLDVWKTGKERDRELLMESQAEFLQHENWIGRGENEVCTWAGRARAGGVL